MLTTHADDALAFHVIRWSYTSHDEAAWRSPTWLTAYWEHSLAPHLMPHAGAPHCTLTFHVARQCCRLSAHAPAAQWHCILTSHSSHLSVAPRVALRRTLWHHLQSPHSDFAHRFDALYADTTNRCHKSASDVAFFRSKRLSSVPRRPRLCRRAYSPPRSCTSFHRTRACDTYSLAVLLCAAPLFPVPRHASLCPPRCRTAHLGSAPHSSVPHDTPRRRTAPFGDRLHSLAPHRIPRHYTALLCTTLHTLAAHYTPWHFSALLGDSLHSSALLGAARRSSVTHCASRCHTALLAFTLHFSLPHHTPPCRTALLGAAPHRVPPASSVLQCTRLYIVMLH
jgi:hypothetical protein